MLGGFFRKSERPLGLDVGAHALRLMQISDGADQAHVDHATSVPLPEDLRPTQPDYHARLGELLRAAVEQGGFTQRRVVSLLPSEALQCKNVRLPKMPPDELAAAVAFEAGDRLKLGDGLPSLQFLNVGEVRQGDVLRQEIILLATAMTFVEGHVKMLVDAGLQPQAIDAVPTTLARSVAGLPSHDASTATAVIDLGHSASKVTICRGEQVLFYKSIDLGLRHLQQAAEAHEFDANAPSPEMQQKLQKPLAELGREIGLCLRYFGVTFRGERPARALVVGGGASLPWLLTSLSEPAGVTLEAFPADAAADWSAVRNIIKPGDEAAWTLSLGLALRSVTGRSQQHSASSTTSPRGIAA